MSGKQREQVDKAGKAKIWMGNFFLNCGGLHIIPVVETIHYKWIHFILYKSYHSKVDLNKKQQMKLHRKKNLILTHQICSLHDRNRA